MQDMVASTSLSLHLLDILWFTIHYADLFDGIYDCIYFFDFIALLLWFHCIYIYELSWDNIGVWSMWLLESIHGHECWKAFICNSCTPIELSATNYYIVWYTCVLEGTQIILANDIWFIYLLSGYLSVRADVYFLRIALYVWVCDSIHIVFLLNFYFWVYIIISIFYCYVVCNNSDFQWIKKKISLLILLTL